MSKRAERLSRDVVICNRRGLHARASAKFARETARFEAQITVSKDGMNVVGTSIMGLMMLGAAKGDTISISAAGSGAEDALAKMCTLVEDRFGEEE